MFINRLEISGNNRLMIRGVNKISLTFNEVHQLILGTNGSGKALLDGTPVRTDNGWVNIEDLKVGDKVLGEDNEYHNVLGVYPQGDNRELYKFYFEDGRDIIVDSEHLWKVHNGHYNWEVMSTIALVNRRENGETFYIPLINYADKEFQYQLASRKTKGKCYNYKSNALKQLEIYRSQGYYASLVKRGNRKTFYYILLKNSPSLKIERIEKLDYTGSTTCIAVDNPSHLFVAKDYIVTHNTTIIQELSALPPDGKDYVKGGYRIIDIEHKNVQYRLTSTFNKQAGEHSFLNLDTNEEMNSGGTQSVQRTLIQEIFGYDQSLHELLTDQIKFSQMSPIQRREWLTRISGTNLDFAINIFNQVKKAQRDEEAVIKHFSQRLNKEADKIPNKQEIDAINSEVDSLNSYLEFLRSKKFNLNSNESFNSELYSYNQLLQSILKKAKDILRMDIKTPDGIDNIDDFRSYLSKEHFKINNIKGLIEKAELEHIEIQNIINETDNSGDLTSLQEELSRLIKESSESVNLLEVFNKDTKEAGKLLGSLQGIKDTLVEHLSEMIDNSEEYFTSEKQNENQEKLTKLYEELELWKSRKEKVNHQLYHIENTEAVDCEKCGHNFKPGIKPESLPKLKEALSKCDASINSLENKIKEIEVYIDECLNYVNHYKTIRTLAKNTPHLKQFWDRVFDINFTKGSTKPVISLLYKAIKDLEILDTLEINAKEIYKLEATIDKLKAVENNGYYTKAKLESIEEEIQKLKEELTVLKVNVNFYADEFDKAIAINNSFIEYKQMLESMKEKQSYLFNKAASDWTDNQIKEVNIKMGSLVHKQNEMQATLRIIEDVTNSRQKSIEKSEILKILVNEINPTTGLIADFFQQFINQFVDQVNVILGKIWEHNIELLPCGLDDNGLTYKFPLRVNDSEFGPPDCSKGSNSQISIVNFAFKIVVMIYLGLEDYPLYLDELAPDLDEKHRINIVNFVRSFVESKRCSQMFMVSHYETGYGAFTNAEILVLDSDNLIDIPRVHNKHVIIERGVKQDA